jgi:hypothetical protein
LAVSVACLAGGSILRALASPSAAHGDLSEGRRNVIAFLASICSVALVLQGVSKDDTNFTQYDYALKITNDSSTPLEAINLELAWARADSSSLRDNWLFDTFSAAGEPPITEYWSTLADSDLQPGASTTLRFTSPWLTSVNYSAYFFNPITYDEFEENGVLTVDHRMGPIEVPEPATLLLAFACATWLCLERPRKRHGPHEPGLSPRSKPSLA